MISLTVFVTRDCNFNCAYCTHRRENKKFSKKLAEKVADFANLNGVKTVSFFGGEPLLNYSVVKHFINYSNKRGYKFLIGLITNGYLLSTDKVKFLAKNKVQLAISFDGISRNENRVTVKGKNSTLKVYKNLLNAVKYTKFELCTVLNKNAIEGIASDYISLFERGVTTIKTAINEEFGEWTDEEISLLKEEYSKVLNYVIAKYKEGKRLKFTDVLDIAEIKIFNNGGFINSCDFGNQGVAVDENGYLYPCTQFVFDKANIIGNIESGIDEEKLNLIKSKYCKPIFNECKDCSANFICHYGCACKNYSNLNKLENKTSCKYFKMKLSLVEEIIEKYNRGDYGTR